MSAGGTLSYTRGVGALKPKEAPDTAGGPEIFLGKGVMAPASQCGTLADPRSSLCKGLGLRQGVWAEGVGAEAGAGV